MSSCEGFVDRSLVERMASEGRTTREIADAVRVSLRTFFRIKGRDELLRHAYERGLREHAAKQGRQVVALTKGKGRLAVVPVTHRTPDEWQEIHQDKTTAVYEYVRANEGATFDEIATALRMGENALCDVWVELILNRRVVRAVWCSTVVQRRYYPRNALARAA